MAAMDASSSGGVTLSGGSRRVHDRRSVSSYADERTFGAGLTEAERLFGVKKYFEQVFAFGFGAWYGSAKHTFDRQVTAGETQGDFDDRPDTDQPAAPDPRDDRPVDARA